MATIPFSLNEFNHFSTCPPDVLDGEISRLSIRMRLQSLQTETERQLYQEEMNRLTALKYISRLRKGQLNRDEFRQKVELTL